MKSLKLVWILLFLLGLAMEYAQGQQSQSRKAQLRASIKSADAFDQISADSVLAYAKAAEALLQEGDSLLLYYDVYRCLSRAYYRRNQKQEMRQASEKVLGYALEMKDSLLIARSYRSLAMAAPAVSNVEAKDFIQKALQYAQGSGADYKRIYMLSLQIQAYLIKYEDPQLAQSIRRQVLKTAIELKDSTLIGKTYETFGTYYRNFQVDSAIYYFSQARTLYQASGNKSFLASVYGKLGTCYQLKDEPDSVLLLAQNAYELGKETGTLSAQRAGLKLLIQHFSSQGDFTSALSYAEELLAIDEKKPSGYRSLIYLDIGEVYEKMGDKEQAQVYYGQALEQAMKDRYPPGIATARSNLGELAFQQGNLSEAKEQFSKVDAMYASMNIEAARVESFQRLGDIALLQTDFSEARSLFQNLLSTAEKLEDISAQANAHRGLASCDSAIGRPAEAFGHLNQYVALSDSFNRNNFNEKVAELQTKLETERKEAEIELLEQQARLQESELSQARSERNLYRTLGLAGLVILLVVGGFLLLLNKSRLQIKSQAEELLSLNQTKDDLFGIIAHDLKGPISGFQTLGRIFSHYLPEDSPKRLKQITQQLEQQSTHLNRLLDNLLQWALQQLGQYQVESETFSLQDLAQELVALNSPAAIAKENKLVLDIPEDLQISGDQRGWSIVLNNLLSNAIKFTERGQISLRVEPGIKNTPQLILQDSGVGMSPEQLAQLSESTVMLSTKGTHGERGTGLGVRIVKELVEQWGLAMKIDSQLGEGTTIAISLPEKP